MPLSWCRPNWSIRRSCSLQFLSILAATGAPGCSGPAAKAAPASAPAPVGSTPLLVGGAPAAVASAPAAMGSAPDPVASAAAPAVRASSKKVCAGGSKPESLSDLVKSPGEVVAADLNGDHRVDLVVAQADPDTGVRILFNTGSSLQTGQWRCTQLPADGPANRLAIGDIDGDGFLDIVGGSWTGLGVHWWSLRGDGSLGSQGQFTVPPPEPKGDCERSGNHIQLAALALGDVEADGHLWLGTTLYSRAINHEACMTQRLWQFDASSKSFVERRKFTAPGAMRSRFADVDGDDFLDYVESSSTIGCSNGGQSNCSDRAEWGDWFARSNGARRALTLSIPGSNGHDVPALRGVDFDVWPSGLARRLNQPAGETLFALAITAEDACETDDCWDNPRQGGYAVAVRAGGTIDWSSKEAELQEEAKRKPDRLATRSIVFVGSSPGPGIVAAYRWARHCVTADCSQRASLNAIVDNGGATRDCRPGLKACAPLFTTDPDALFQAMIATELRDDRLQQVDDTQALRKGQRIAYLGRRHASEIDAVTFKPAGAADFAAIRFTFVPGDSWITVNPSHGAGTLRMQYRAADKPDIVLADSNRGLQFF
ncbi:MAG TPA: VCBS repeat-containing protein [Polyangiaceae bacterium]|nr:VCBS repeat-containing protein [Polyangiaceae bacterium]